MGAKTLNGKGTYWFAKDQISRDQIFVATFWPD